MSHTKIFDFSEQEAVSAGEQQQPPANDGAETTTSTDLVVISENTPLLAFSTENGLDPIIEEIRRRVESEDLDVTTEEGRARIGSVAKKIGSAKMRMVEKADEVAADAKRIVDNVRKERQRMETEMDNMRDKVLAPRVAYFEREKSRVEAHNTAIGTLNDMEFFTDARFEPPTAEEIQNRIQDVEAFEKDRDWQEFADKALGTRMRVLQNLRKRLDDVKAEEEKAEKERQEAARKQVHTDHLNKIAQIADIKWPEHTVDEIQALIDSVAPYSKLDWEEFHEEADRVIRKAQNDLTAAQAERKTWDDAQAELETRRSQDAANESNRLAAEKAETDRKEAHERNIAAIVIQANILPTDSAEKLAGKIEVLDGGWKNAADWQEFKEKAEQAYTNTRAGLVAARERAVEREKQAAEADTQRKAGLSAKIADIRALSSFIEPPTLEQVAARAEAFKRYCEMDFAEFEGEANQALETVKSALEAENDKAKFRADEKLRQENIEHQRAINKMAKEDLIGLDHPSLTEELAEFIVKGIIGKKIRNVSIKY